MSDVGWGLGFEVAVLLGAGVTFFLLARDFGPAEYGYYAAIQGYISVVSPLVTGWPGFVILDETVREGVDLRGTFKALTTSVAVCALGVLLLTVLVAHPLLPKVSVWTTVAFIAAEVLGNSVAQTSAATIQAVKGFASSTRPRLVLSGFQTIAIVALWRFHHLTLTSVAVSTLAINVAVGVVVLFLCLRSCGLSLGIGRPTSGQVGKGSLYALVLLCFAVEEDADKTLLVEYGFDRIAGTYAAAYRVVQFGLLPLRVMVSATHRRFLQHDPSATKQHWRRSVRLTVPSVIYGLVAVIGIEVCAPLVPMLLGRAYDGTVVMIRCLAVLVLYRSITSFAFNGLMGLGKRGWRTTVLGVSAAINLLLNLTLIPVISWKGAIIATVAGETFYATLTWYGLRKFQRQHDLGLVGSSPTE